MCPVKYINAPETNKKAGYRQQTANQQNIQDF